MVTKCVSKSLSNCGCSVIACNRVLNNCIERGSGSWHGNLQRDCPASFHISGFDRNRARGARRRRYCIRCTSYTGSLIGNSFVIYGQRLNIVTAQNKIVTIYRCRQADLIGLVVDQSRHAGNIDGSGTATNGATNGELRPVEEVDITFNDLRGVDGESLLE